MSLLRMFEKTCRARACRRMVIWPLALLAVFALAGCSKGAQSEIVMGTVCRIDLFESGNARRYRLLFDRLAELDRLLSANRDDSELALLSRNAGLQPVAISPELFTVLERSLHFAEVSGGGFDPTIGPLVQLWGIATDNPRIPSDNELAAALDLVNWRDVAITAQSGESPATAFLKRPGMSLDLGAIAKGFIADELVRLLEQQRIPRAIIDLGGDIVLWGQRADGRHWRIGVQNPVDQRGTFAGILEIGSNTAVTTSGVYERYFFGEDGTRYHHIFGLLETESGSRAGFPVENGLLSVTVFTDSAMYADALSISAFVLGYEQGLELAKAYGAEILFIFDDKTISGSPGALAAFTLAGDFRLMPAHRQ